MKNIKIDYVPRYTYSEYANWEGRWELIQGVPHAMTPLPTIEHQKASGNIHLELQRGLKNCKKCAPLLPVDWKIDEETVLQPDNMVVCGEISGKYLARAPAIIFEIISPSTEMKDRQIKYRIYEAEKVKYYILVNVSSQTAQIFELDGDAYKKIKETRSGTVFFDLGECSFDFDFGRIWRALP